MKTDETSRFRRKKEGKLNGWMKKRRHEGGENKQNVLDYLPCCPGSAVPTYCIVISMLFYVCLHCV